MNKGLKATLISIFFSIAFTFNSISATKPSATINHDFLKKLYSYKAAACSRMTELTQAERTIKQECLGLNDLKEIFLFAKDEFSKQKVTEIDERLTLLKKFLQNASEEMDKLTEYLMKLDRERIN